MVCHQGGFGHRMVSVWFCGKRVGMSIFRPVFFCYFYLIRILHKNLNERGVFMCSEKSTKAAKVGYIVISLLFCALGIMLIFRPEMTVPVIAAAFGALLILFGIVKIIGYFSKDLFRLAFQYDLALGILLMALGVIIILKSDNIMVFISVVLGVYVLADGLLKIQIALDSKIFGIGQWWLIFAAAIITGIIGCMLIIRPSQSAGVIAVLIGCCLLAEGILNLITVILAVKIIKYQKPDQIDVVGFRVR